MCLFFIISYFFILIINVLFNIWILKIHGGERDGMWNDYNGPKRCQARCLGCFFILIYFLYLTNVLFHTATTGQALMMTAGVRETVLALYVKDLHP